MGNYCGCMTNIRAENMLIHHEFMLWYRLRPNCALVLWWLIDVSLYLRAGFESPRLLRCIYVSHMHVFGGFNYLYDYDDYTKYSSVIYPSVICSSVIYSN